MSYLNIIFIGIALICLCICILITCKLLFIIKRKSTVQFNSISNNLKYDSNNKKKNQSYRMILSNMIVIGGFLLGINLGKSVEQKVTTYNTNTKYYSSALLVDGEIVPIESINSDNSTNKDNIKENNDLLNIAPFDILNVNQNIDAIDSYGNLHTNSFVFDGQNSYAKFMLDAKYSVLEFNLSIENTADMNQEGVLTIVADGNTLYMSPVMTKTTAPIDMSISVENCRVLSIEYNSDEKNPCIISDVILHE